MQHWRLIAIGVAMTLAATGMAQEEDAEQAIHDLTARWQELYNQGDRQGVAGLYTQDGTFFGIDGRVHEGRDAIATYLEEPLPFPPGEGTITIETDEVEVLGDAAVVTGRYAIDAPDGTRVVHGNYMTFNQREGGEWRIHRHIGNMVPPRAPSPTAEPDDASMLRSEIEAANEAFMDAFEQQDATAMAELYTQEGQALPPGGPTATGRDAVAAVWRGAMDAGARRVGLATVEVEGFGDTAHEVGDYTLYGERDEVMDEGRYLVVWKRVNGDWRLHRDIWNTRRAPDGP